jgi:hypothetical protein
MNFAFYSRRARGKGRGAMLPPPPERGSVTRSGAGALFEADCIRAAKANGALPLMQPRSVLGGSVQMRPKGRLLFNTFLTPDLKMNFIAGK